MVKQGDIIYLDFDPQAGTEQAGIRPALVVSNERFQRFTGKRVIVCPISRTHKGYAAHISLDQRTKTRGVVLCDQIRTVDTEARGYRLIEKAPDDILDEVLDVIDGFFDT